MTKLQREAIYKLLTTNYKLEFGEGWVSAAEIDELGLADAMRLGVKKALTELEARDDEEIVLDGNANYLPERFTNAKCLIDADATIPLVSAASIYAKVRRDAYMSKLKNSYPLYGFEKHVGYGTKVHREAIQQNGIIEGLHRLSFKPIQLLSS